MSVRKIIIILVTLLAVISIYYYVKNKGEDKVRSILSEKLGKAGSFDSLSIQGTGIQASGFRYGTAISAKSIRFKPDIFSLLSKEGERIIPFTAEEVSLRGIRVTRISGKITLWNKDSIKLDIRAEWAQDSTIYLIGKGRRFGNGLVLKEAELRMADLMLQADSLQMDKTGRYRLAGRLTADQIKLEKTVLKRVAVTVVLDEKQVRFQKFTACVFSGQTSGKGIILRMGEGFQYDVNIHYKNIDLNQLPVDRKRVRFTGAFSGDMRVNGKAKDLSELSVKLFRPETPMF
ncbi:MAG: hypothetical protein A2293_12105 [Elusimicrobia bacterium RIFOXYB2_FULL_49_7]|nr:MAG: hypothetical protein A2293_12105 [Elusimicrobia bacterium RIFOXYB2_FULL_49_7]